MYKVGYLGPKYTFTEKAALRYLDTKSGEAFECSSIEEIFSKIDDGLLDEGVVPVENSTEGSVTTVLDLLAGPFNFAVRGEIILPVNQCLMARSGVRLSQVEKVISHPQALAQCRELLRRELPGVVLEECSSTAAAAVLVASSDYPWAAVGSREAALANGLEIVISVANDYPDNATRFWIVGREEMEPLDIECKTSIIFGLNDQPGALYVVLKEFAERGINLTRIESRPAKKRLGDYLFFVDFIGNKNRPEVQDLLQKIREITQVMKFLGSYQEIRK